MTRMGRQLTRLVVAALLLSGCAGTSPRPAYDETRKLVLERTGHAISWNQGGDDDAAAQKKVSELLARELTPQAAVQIALLQNKRLQATYEELAIAQADLVQAGLLHNPVFQAGLSFPVAGNASTGGGISVTQDFLSIFLLAARKRLAQSELSAAELRVGNAVLDTAYDVESAYYALSAAQQIVLMRRTILEAGDIAVDLARRQHEAGNISDLDLANQEAQYEQVRTDLVRSQADVITARESLTRLLGLWGEGARYRVAEKLPELPPGEPDLTHLETLATSRRLDLLSARHEGQALAHALDMAESWRFLGGATVSGAYERSPEGFSVAGPGAGLELPIFDQKRAEIAKLAARLRAAHAREVAMTVDVKSEVRAARGRLEATRALVDRYTRVVVPLRRKVVALSEEQHNAMLLGAYQVLLAKQNEVTAYLELILALRDYWTAHADLSRAIGGALPDASPSAPSPVAAPPPGPAPAPVPAAPAAPAHVHSHGASQ
jgi:cobalt-zinc-cadmium efflux system outer membrane protein